MGAEDIERFSNGQMAAPVRIGTTVRRNLPDGWQGTHAVLKHLEATGASWAPRLLHTDSEHEWLSFIPGTNVDRLDPSGHDPAMCHAVGRLMREVHGTMATFIAPRGIAWPPSPPEPLPNDTYCHNDVSRWNVIVDEGGTISGLIDWDLVRPGNHRWDLAYAAWRFGIVTGDMDGLGTARERAERIRALLDGYGLHSANRHGFVDLIAQRLQHGADRIVMLGTRGIPAYRRLLDQGAHQWGASSQQWLETHRRQLVRDVES